MYVAADRCGQTTHLEGCSNNPENSGLDRKDSNAGGKQGDSRQILKRELVFC